MLYCSPLCSLGRGWGEFGPTKKTKHSSSKLFVKIHIKVKMYVCQ